jgi:hypothetical protein
MPPSLLCLCDNRDLVEVVRPYLALRIESDAFPIPDRKLLTGIAVAPLTGPPKLSA